MEEQSTQANCLVGTVQHYILHECRIATDLSTSMPLGSGLDVKMEKEAGRIAPGSSTSPYTGFGMSMPSLFHPFVL